MKGVKTAIVATLLAGCLAVAGFMGCGQAKSIVSIGKQYSDGSTDVYRVVYSDGSTSDFTVENNGLSSQITVADLYEEYKKQYGEDVTFDEFVSKYIGAATDSTAVIQNCLRSSVSVYAEFTKTSYRVDFLGRPVVSGTSAVMQIGSGIIYSMDEQSTYIVTNYHVIYGENTDQSFTDILHIYLYGSESAPADGNDGTYVYDDYAIDCEYIGGSVDHDIAVLRADTQDVLAINDNVAEVEIADDYSVGQTAIAIGNTGGYGISATKGIVSVDNEYVALSIDGTTRSYRSIRMDTAIYSGNSGGGLFDMYGRLIGLTNSGATEEQNVNFAIPVQIVTGAADNIIYNSQNGLYDGMSEENKTVRKPTLGVELASLNVRNAYDAVTNTSRITEDVFVSSVSENSIAAKAGLQQGDIITGFTVADKSYSITRSFQVGDILLTIRSGDTISFTVKRDGNHVTSGSYTVAASDIT